MIFTKENYSHILYYKKPDVFDFSESLEAFICLFAHELAWHQKMESAHELIFQDDLTGLYNHRYLEQMLEREIARSSRFNDYFSLMFIDLDNFKAVNDNHGHLVGSELLKKVSKEIQCAVREIDSVMRYGGDEFIVILLGASIDQAMIVAERVRDSVESFRLRLQNGQKIGVTASVGLSCYPEHGETKQELLAVADDNMYLSKESGKNCIRISNRIDHEIR